MGALGLQPHLSQAADDSKDKNFLRGVPQMHLGLVTYNLAQDWDIPTIIKNCEVTKFEGVELRTTHAHKVEVNLSNEERKEVKKRFEGSKVRLMGLGGIFDYHTPDRGSKCVRMVCPRKFPWRRLWPKSEMPWGSWALSPTTMAR